ncbi:MAG: hypothetical protein GQ529_10500 [Methyloprofundus sp.]|nr:hypothetical protein [Methyloprofundus sp.]
MIDQVDPRQLTRTNEPSEISYKFPDAEQSYICDCINMNGAGILFRADQFIEEGRALEVKSVGGNALSPSMIAYVEVISSNEVSPGMYDVTTEIKGIKEI